MIIKFRFPDTSSKYDISCYATVRYFDCVCNNVRNGDAKDISKHIIFEYFNHDNLLIMQTAFDKFAKLVSTDKKFASEIAHILLDNLTEQAEKNINDIKTIIEGLDENKRSLYEIYHGRLKVKFKYDYCNTRLSVESDEELCMINDKINELPREIKFIGKVKKLIEEREYESNPYHRNKAENDKLIAQYGLSLFVQTNGQRFILDSGYDDSAKKTLTRWFYCGDIGASLFLIIITTISAIKVLPDAATQTNIYLSEARLITVYEKMV